MDSSRQRMIDTTARLLWSQGLRATGMDQIVRESKAPRGSIYFHFPDGKEQLAVEALRAAGAVMTANITGALDQRDAVTAVKKFVAVYAKEMRTSGFHHGCPIATVALEASTTSPAIRTVCAAVFGQWEDLLARRMERDGYARRDARRYAVLTLSLLEGAMILCRARRTTRPLHDVGAHLAEVLTAAARTRPRARARRARSRSTPRTARAGGGGRAARATSSPRPRRPRARRPRAW
jgi:TetR/AcrR family transcriptional repressor of lmrAB and yxaGH operons